LKDRLFWIDLEMTGLNPDTHVILQIASIVTDANLEIVAEGPDIAIHIPREALLSMEEWSRVHHQASGLLERASASPYDCRGAEQETLDFLRQHCREGKSPLCGNSIWQDRRFLVKQMPVLEASLHYRNIDVSTLKELVGRWYPSLPRFPKEKSHLALQDIRESIQELKYYRERVFVDPRVPLEKPRSSTDR
jgi:oligoribonuclease